MRAGEERTLINPADKTGTHIQIVTQLKGDDSYNIVNTKYIFKRYLNCIINFN